MRKRRQLVLAAVAVASFAALAVNLSAEEGQTPAPRLANLLRSDLEGIDGAEVIVSLVEIPPNTTLPRHHHPGEEFVYVLEGAGKLWFKDAPDVQLKAGEVAKVPLRAVHTAVTGESGIKALVFRVHKKGEPERVLSE